MAMENFQITELLGLVFHNPDGTLAGLVEYMDGITIDNTSSEQELRSGVGNTVIYSLSSEFESTLTGDCVMSTDLFKILTSTTPQSGTQKFMESEILKASGNTIVLPHELAAGGKIHVFPLDVNGVRQTELRVGTPASNPLDYSISEKTITVHSDLSGDSFKVIYERVGNGTLFSKEAKDSNIYRVVGRGKVVDLATKEKKVGNFLIGSFKPSTAFSVGMSNGDFTKVTLTGDCLLDTITGTTWQFVAED